jgi:uncharacterized phiE125 gp8 family phage protein
MNRGIWTRYAVFLDVAVEPVTAADLRSQIRVIATDEDAILAGYIKTARVQLENRLGRKFINQTWDVYYERLDDPLHLPFGPLGASGIASVKYQDGNNVQQSAAVTLYETAEQYRRPIVRTKYGQVWPATLGHYDDVVVRAQFGYGADGTSVPTPINQAILLLAAWINESREPGIIEWSAIDSLLADYSLLMPNDIED